MLAPDGPAVELRYLSPDGEEGFPGNLRVLAVYTLTHDNGLRLDFTATTDQDTIVNLTHHSYFNLAGRGDVLHHFMQINADQFTPVDSTLIPTGRLQSVAGTPFDFRRPAAIGARIEEKDEQLKLGPQLGPQQSAQSTGGHRAGDGADIGPGAGGAFHPARRAILQRQLSGRHDHRQRRLGLSTPPRPLPGAAAFPRFHPPSQFSQRGAPARGNLPPHHHLSFLDRMIHFSLPFRFSA